MIKKIPRKIWRWNNNHRLCSRHFSADDYKVGSLDTNARRRIKKDQQVRRKILKNNSVPSIWPGFPSHLTKTTKPRSTKLTSSTYRREQASLIVELNDSFGDLKGIHEKVPISDLPKGVHKVFEQGSHLSFIKLSFEHKPRVEYCLRIHPSLEYQVWVRDTQLSVTDLCEKSFSVPMVNSVSMITKILCSLEDLKNEDVRSDAQIIGNVVDELKRTSLWGNVKIKFLCEQLLLVVKTSNGRRYSQYVLALACMWQNVSPALYKQIQVDGGFNSSKLQVCAEIKFRVDSKSPS